MCTPARRSRAATASRTRDGSDPEELCSLLLISCVVISAGKLLSEIAMKPTSPIVDPALEGELAAVYALYATLVRDLHSDDGTGGKLLYAGELDQDGIRLVRASNIAGAASLSATSDAAVQRSAIRDGVIDFLVNSLDEALRILKNEIRKRCGVAVGVAAPPSQIASEMRSRGVAPDLFRENAAENPSLTIDNKLIVLHSPPAGFERLALELLPDSDFAARRWLQLSPRYLGPQARRVRSVPFNAALAAALDKGL
jgi:hypothetical protein